MATNSNRYEPPPSPRRDYTPEADQARGGEGEGQAGAGGCEREGASVAGNYSRRVGRGRFQCERGACAG